MPRGEAVHYRERAVELGVPSSAVLVEPRARNTGENIRFSREVLEEAGVQVASVLLISKPYEERRAYATARKLWPEVEIVSASTPMALDEYVDCRRGRGVPATPPSRFHQSTPADRFALCLTDAESCYRFLYLIKARARRGRAPPLRRGLPPVCAPAGRARRRAACMRAEAGTSSAGQRHASGGGAQTLGWEGRRTRVPAGYWRALWAPIPSTVDPGRAEQTRPVASRSFVQWRAPPGRHEPRPLHGVWVDGRRDGSWGEWRVAAIREGEGGVREA